MTATHVNSNRAWRTEFAAGYDRCSPLRRLRRCGGGGVLGGVCDCDGNILDECGVCGGDGIPEGACDCDGNFPVDGYDCDGVCLNDADGDGVCDEFEIVGCQDEIGMQLRRDSYRCR